MAVSDANGYRMHRPALAGCCSSIVMSVESVTLAGVEGNR
jgi:hypothetical protein